MIRIFNLLLKLYPAEFREAFGAEMRSVVVSLASEGRMPAGFWWRECSGLVRGAAREHGVRVAGRIPALAGGAVFAFALQFLVYWRLIPVRTVGLSRVLARVFSHLFLLCLVVGIAFSQPVKQDPATLELAKGIYRAAFTGLREAKTMEDMRKVSDSMDSPEWISVDRFGRTILTKKEADRDLESLLSLPPERRAGAMEILWAEQDSDRLIVVAWMMPNESKRVDADGEFGPRGATHQLTRATLIRDLFAKTPAGWRRIRHDKLTPNDIVVAVDGTARVVPPMDERHRVMVQ